MSTSMITLNNIIQIDVTYIIFQKIGHLDNLK